MSTTTRPPRVATIRNPAGESMAAARETRAITQQLIKRKPAANVNGIIEFTEDMSRHFSLEEQFRIAASPSGQMLSHAADKCQSQRANFVRAQQQYQNVRQAQQQQMVTEGTGETVQTPEKNQQQQAALVVKEKQRLYSDCLSYWVCPDRWKQYTQCWGQLAHFNASELHKLREEGGLQFFCQDQRHALECCVGQQVSNTVASAENIDDGLSESELL